MKQFFKGFWLLCSSLFVAVSIWFIGTMIFIMLGLYLQIWQ